MTELSDKKCLWCPEFVALDTANDKYEPEVCDACNRKIDRINSILFELTTRLKLEDIPPLLLKITGNLVSLIDNELTESTGEVLELDRLSGQVEHALWDKGINFIDTIISEISEKHPITPITSAKGLTFKLVERNTFRYRRNEPHSFFEAYKNGHPTYRLWMTNEQIRACIKNNPNETESLSEGLLPIIN